MEKHRVQALFWMVALLFCCLVASFGMGKYPVSPAELFQVLISKILPIEQTWDSQVETVLFKIRFPRVAMGCLVGAGLSCAGAAYQGIFQNPMASPDLLGASSGAGFGAALAIYLSLGYVGTSAAAFLCGVGVVALVYLISRKVKNNQTLGLVLAGILVSSLLSSGTSFLKLVADPKDKLPSITYWLMGSLASVQGRDVAFAAPVILLGMIPIFLWRWKINVLTMGDEEAKTMGIRTDALRTGIVACATLVTAACVAVSGMIGWVGLVIPHLARMLVGSDYRYMLPASVLLGGSFMLVVDNFARLLSTSEIPIGILTAFIGAPFFLYLIMREGKRI